MAVLITKVKIELDPEEFRSFSRYQQNHEYSSLDEAIKAAALRSLPKRKSWNNKSITTNLNRNL